ncbi:uncharacterized protein EI90DRAFT_1605675 [Cantharellus anzutake]|uniref:uncharacterized protein n=1 Tax=Cantharellus anzutake TaxID=1750568 RepID=UPI001905FC69|nr:uncharacterized protein EI90DRAFT_1605675 [Cantharellus anzutake]KAF8328138.1 hypothetical protein EI90DRAFT_1605675 [Cantharellus anzutake]
MDLTPPWEGEECANDGQPQRVFWQSSQNPQRFLDRVMNEMGTSSPEPQTSSTIQRSISAPSMMNMTPKRKHPDSLSDLSYSSCPTSAAAPEVKRSRARARRPFANRDGSRQAQGGQSTMDIDIDMDRITILVNNDTTNGASHEPQSIPKEPSLPTTARRVDALSHPVLFSQSYRTGDVGLRPKDSTSKPLNPDSVPPSLPSSSLQVHLPPSQTSNRPRHMPPPPPPLTKFATPTASSINSSKSSSSNAPQSRPPNTRNLGMKGLSRSSSSREIIAKPFKVPFAVAEPKKKMEPPPPQSSQPCSKTEASLHPEPKIPTSSQLKDAPMASPSGKDLYLSLPNMSSSSDSFDMDSFGDDQQAIEACLSRYD